MSSGQLSPGSAKDDSVTGSTMSRGEITSLIEEAPNQSSSLGLWEPQRTVLREIERTRTRLAQIALGLLAFFMFIGIGSITWVTLAGKPAAELGNCVEAIGTPLFGLVMLVIGYYYGHSERKTARKDRD